MGDKEAGRRELFLAFSRLEPIPKIDNSATNLTYLDSLKFEGKDFYYMFVDIPGQVDRARACDMSDFYCNTSVVMICFSIASADTFRSVPRYLSEVKMYAPNAPIMLIGCGSEKREKKTVCSIILFFFFYQFFFFLGKRKSDSP